MSRKLRIQYLGAIYHVMNRGDHQGNWHYGAELSESGEAKADRLITQALQTAGF
jgi:hypothetical protein